MKRKRTRLGFWKKIGLKMDKEKNERRGEQMMMMMMRMFYSSSFSIYLLFLSYASSLISIRLDLSALLRNGRQAEDT